MSEFGTGYVLDGSHKLLKKGRSNYCHAPYEYSQATIQEVTEESTKSQEKVAVVNHCIVKQFSRARGSSGRTATKM